MTRPDFTTDELNRRLTTLHPIARRQLARMTDSTYRGPHNISSAEQETPYLFGLHPLSLIVPAVLAVVLMVVDPLGAFILGGSQ